MKIKMVFEDMGLKIMMSKCAQLENTPQHDQTLNYNENICKLGGHVGKGAPN
jgi:hypothetical protein